MVAKVTRVDVKKHVQQLPTVKVVNEIFPPDGELGNNIIFYSGIIFSVFVLFAILGFIAFKIYQWVYPNSDKSMSEKLEEIISDNYKKLETKYEQLELVNKQLMEANESGKRRLIDFEKILNESKADSEKPKEP